LVGDGVPDAFQVGALQTYGQVKALKAQVEKESAHYLELIKAKQKTITSNGVALAKATDKAAIDKINTDNTKLLEDKTKLQNYYDELKLYITAIDKFKELYKKSYQAHSNTASAEKTLTGKQKACSDAESALKAAQEALKMAENEVSTKKKTEETENTNCKTGSKEVSDLKTKFADTETQAKAVV